MKTGTKKLLAAIAVLISLIIVLTLTFAPQPTFTAEEKKGGSAGRLTTT